MTLAAFGGTLTRTRRGCLALDIGGGELVVTQLPSGSTLTDDGRGGTLPDRTVVRLGGSISGGEVPVRQEARSAYHLSA